MSLFFRRLLLPAARNVGAVLRVASSRGASDVPIRKGPFWDAGWPYPYMRPWVDVWDDRQREYLTKMDRLLRVSPWRRLESAEAKQGKGLGVNTQEIGPQSDINRITLSKDKLQIEVEMNVANYGSEDIFVNQTGDWLIVNAQHTVRADKYGYVTRQLIRQIYLPEGLNKDSTAGVYTENGNLVLTIKALNEEGYNRVEKLLGSAKEDTNPCTPCK